MKPRPEIFLAALDTLGVKAEAAVMVGDSLRRDMQGAVSVGMKAIWFVPERRHAELVKEVSDIPIITGLEQVVDMLL